MFLPRLFTTCCPQEKIFQDKFAVVGIERRTAGAAGDIMIGGRFRSGFNSDSSQHLITMSRGLGRIERAILGMIQDKDVCEERYTAVDLARAIYQRPRPNQAEHVAALRAMRSLVRKFSRIALC